MGKTALNEYRTKNMCKMGNGNFRTVHSRTRTSPCFVSRQLRRWSTKSSTTKKLMVRVMGYAKGLMCSHLAPRMQVLFNDKVISSTWATSKTSSKNDRDRATSWSIEPPCKEKDGSKGLNQIFTMARVLILSTQTLTGGCVSSGRTLLRAINLTISTLANRQKRWTVTSSRVSD